MIEIFEELLNLINEPEISEDNAKRIKDLICYLSEKKIHESINEHLYEYVDVLIYLGSVKIRTFGYTTNPLNPLNNEEIFKDDFMLSLKNESIMNYYRSNIYPNCVLDKRQKQILEVFKKLEYKRLFLSAPTSFGKTFLLKEIINDNYGSFNNIVIVLPTVALLQEVTEDLEGFFKFKELKYQIINSIFRDLNLIEKNVFILTPERVVRLFAIKPDIKIDFFFYDEIYKIDDDIVVQNDDDYAEKIAIGAEQPFETKNHRAIAFRIALYLLLKKANCFYLAGPYIKIESLKKGFKNFFEVYKVTPYEVSFEPTLKNKIDFTKNKLIVKSPVEGEKSISVDVKTKPEKIQFLKTFLEINEDHQTIFYCLYPSHTNEFARGYSKHIKDNLNKEETENFVNHLEKNYSLGYYDGRFQSVDSWSLLDCLKKGVGIHNGKFPKYFQKEIMRLFNKKQLLVLFCTSTIIEGVNTNAKNIVLIHNPSGESNTSKRFSLLNINGRAGRYLKHFVGNVIYLDSQQNTIEKSNDVSLDFRLFNDDVALSNLDLENIDENEIIGESNRTKKCELEKKFNKTLLPDEVYLENRLIERHLQENILSQILKEEHFNIIKNMTKANIHNFISDGYLTKILEIWALVGEIKFNQVDAIKWFSANFSKDSYYGVLKYEFEKYDKKIDLRKERPQTKEALPKFVDGIYQRVFANIKDTIEYQLPRILALFESLINRAFIIKRQIIEQPIEFTSIIRLFEIGSTTELGLDMIEKGIPIVTVKKIEGIINSEGDINSQKKSLMNNYNQKITQFDSYEQSLINSYIAKIE